MTDTVTINRKLLPCPFCGGEPTVSSFPGTHNVWCSNQPVACGNRSMYTSEQWNRRAQPASAQGEAVEEIVPKWRYDALVQHCKLQDKNIAKLSDERNTAWMYEQREVWFWQGDGEDYPESLSCPVVIKADDLRAILAKLGE